MNPLLARLSGLGIVATGLGLLVAGGCATAVGEQEHDDEDIIETTGGQGGTATGGAGGQGGGASACAVDCSLIAAPACQEAICNETSGQCEIVPLADDTPCDDGMFCTVDDSCQQGICTGGGPNDCGMPVAACQEILCDETSQSCTVGPLADGTPCVGADLCITGSTCSSGLCLGGTPTDCFFFPVPDECHVGACNPTTGMCEAVVGNEGLSCVDPNDLCTENKTCSAGVCSGGTPKSCSHLTSGCDLGVCDTTTGQCTTQTVMNGQVCDDLNACTTGETCMNGVCGSGTPVTVCSLTPDGCCPTSCTAVNDFDCACTNGSLSNYAENNGQDGIMFDIDAISNIEILSFDVNLSATAGTLVPMEVYYRAGTHQGFETTPGSWTLVGSGTATAGGNGNPTPVPIPINVQIPAGQTYAFYVTVSSVTYSVNYQGTGTTPAVGTVYNQDAKMRIKVGTGKVYPFGSNYTHRAYSGEVYYQACGS